MGMLRKKIGIVGYGYVGKVMEKLFEDHYHVRLYDPLLNKCAEDVHKRDIKDCDLVIVCVPTPMDTNGKVMLNAVREVVSWLGNSLILIKSTIPPGTTQELILDYGCNIAFSPEYIGEGNYVTQWWKDKGYPHPTDIKKHDFTIFGGQKDVTSRIVEFFKPVLGPEHQYIQTGSRTAELAKYMQNAWGATKVTFANEFAKIAEALMVNYDELRELWLLDGRTERMHTLVFKDKPGFGGKCLPKDTNGIIQKSIEKGYTPTFLQQVLESNEVFREIK
jgi:nucleotide sugar dehydrogenase